MCMSSITWVTVPCQTACFQQGPVTSPNRPPQQDLKLALRSRKPQGTSASIPLLWGISKASQVQSTCQARGGITICKSTFDCNIGNGVTKEKLEDTHVCTHRHLTTTQEQQAPALALHSRHPFHQTTAVLPGSPAALSGTAERDRPLSFRSKLPSPCLTYSALAQAWGDQLSNAMAITVWAGLGTQLSPRLPPPRVGARDSPCSRTSLLAATQPQIRASHPRLHSSVSLELPICCVP